MFGLDKRLHLIVLGAGTLIGLSTAKTAQAATLGYTLELSPNPNSPFNIPFFQVRNTSTSASIK
jgi:hypothetical protein